MKKTMIYRYRQWHAPSSYGKYWRRVLDGEILPWAYDSSRKKYYTDRAIKVNSIEKITFRGTVLMRKHINSESDKSRDRPYCQLVIDDLKIYKQSRGHESLAHYIAGYGANIGQVLDHYPYKYSDREEAAYRGVEYYWHSYEEFKSAFIMTFEIIPTEIFDINDFGSITGTCHHNYFVDDACQMERSMDATFTFGLDSEIFVEYIPAGQISEPTNVRVDPVSPARGVAIAWDAPELEKESWGAPIGSYNIFRLHEDGTEEREYVYAGSVDSNTFVYFDPNVSEGEYYRYRVQASTATIPPSEEDLSEFDSDLSEPSDITFIQYAPSAPEISNVGTVTYNPNPRIIATISPDTNEFLRLTAQAQGYRISRSTELESNDKVLLARAERLRESSTETVQIANANEQNEASSDPFTFSYVKPVFSEPIIANETEIKAVHINELREMIENVCDYYDIARPVWNEQIVENETPVYRWITHVRELQTEIKRIADYVNAWDSKSTANRIALPEFEQPEFPTASAMNQLRACIALL